jgi:2-succinyl-5-enolpyruvyl-6-hydroxy-3-cyclohexene-1-carboxylate synthase
MSVAIASRQAAFCATLVDELVAHGVTDAVVCPGSRSTPLALAVAGSELNVHVRLDERSASFFALGLARATTTPVLIVVTSGTAAAELLAAVVEASLDHVPLIVATADRPPELHEIGSPQTIRQQGLFGSHVSFALDPGPVHALPRDSWRSLASRLAIEARGRGGPPGPVHLNVPLIEPLLAEPDAVPARRPGGRPWHSVEELAEAPVVPASSEPRRAVILAGAGAGSAEVLLGAAFQLRWPVLADPRSGCRRLGGSAVGGSAVDGAVIAGADAFLRDDAVRSALRPELVVLAGAPPASKVLSEWVGEASAEGAEVLVLGADGPARHPLRTAAGFLYGDPASLLRAMAEAWTPAPDGWLERWAAVEAATQAALDEELSDGRLSEPAVARFLTAQLADPVRLVSSSSMPIRDLEWFGAVRTDPALVLANRGANGIDGVLSTAMGVATARLGPAVCLVGDLAFLHDVSALVDGVDSGASLSIVVVDNAGGGIFSFLPQRTRLDLERFEQLFGTPPRVSVEAVAAGFGLPAVSVASLAELAQALEGCVGAEGARVIVVDAPSRDDNVAVHEALNLAVGRAARVALGSL